MGSPHRIYQEQGLSLRDGGEVPDPGSNGTLDLDPSLAFQVCRVTGTDASVDLPIPIDFALGARVLVILATAGGATVAVQSGNQLLVSGAQGDEAEMGDSGDSLLLHVADVNGAKRWRIIGNDGATVNQ